MQINKIDRKKEIIEIIKDNDEIILLSFGEIDTLPEILFNLKYLVIKNDTAFNHYRLEYHVAEVTNGKYTEKNKKQN